MVTDFELKQVAAGTQAGKAALDALTVEVVNDLTPQLGGNLDVNGKSIVSVSNGHITITPNGNGLLILGNVPLSDPSEEGAVYQSGGALMISLG